MLMRLQITIQKLSYIMAERQVTVAIRKVAQYKLFSLLTTLLYMRDRANFSEFFCSCTFTDEIVERSSVNTFSFLHVFELVAAGINSLKNVSPNLLCCAVRKLNDSNTLTFNFSLS